MRFKLADILRILRKKAITVISMPSRLGTPRLHHSEKALLVITAVAFLAIFAMLAFSGDSVSTVLSKEYGPGEFSYSGEIKGGLFEGNGTISFMDGAVYTGNFYNSRFFGDGVYYKSSSAGTYDWHFEGEFQEGRTGGGTFFFKDGSTIAVICDGSTVSLDGQPWQYNGGLSEGGQNGNGTFTFEDKSVYTGGFLNGLASGEGEYTDTEGSIIYTGGFRNGMFDGLGVYYSPEGWLYEGGFRDGLFDGEGTLVDGDLIAHGVWEKGVQIRRYE